MSSMKAILKEIIPRKYLIRVKNIYLFMRSIFYAGNKYYCPCCEGRFSKFLSLKNYPESYVMCPRCESLERHRLLWMYLTEKTNMFSGKKKVLHIAPEFSFLKLLSKMNGIDYVSADKESPFAEVKMDITKIQYDDNSFDIVFCNHVLEHIPDDKKAMQEIYRVLKPGGWAILQSPVNMKLERTFEDPKVVSPRERQRIFGQRDHVRKYGKDYSERLSNCGFIVNVNGYVRELHEEKINKYKLDRNEDIYHCIKNDYEKIQC